MTFLSRFGFGGFESNFIKTPLPSATVTEPLASIDKSLVTSMVSVAVTYIIVLLQFRISVIQQQ